MVRNCNMGSNKKLQTVKDYAVITLGLVIYLFAYFTFIYSHEITSGGLAEYCFGDQLGI